MNNNETVSIDVYNPKPEDIIVWRFNTESFDFDVANEIFESIKQSFPNNIVVGIPDNSILDACNKDDLIIWLKDLIKYLEELK